MMKTLSKVFTVWCWCMCIAVFGFAKETVNTQEEVFQQVTTEEQTLNNNIEEKEGGK